MTYTMTIRDNIINLDTTAGTITARPIKPKKPSRKNPNQWDRNRSMDDGRAAMEAESTNTATTSGESTTSP